MTDNTIRVAIPILCSACLWVATAPQSVAHNTAINIDNLQPYSDLLEQKPHFLSLDKQESQCPINTNGSQAVAQLYPTENRTILCQRWLDNYTLFRRVLISVDGSTICFDEIVDTRTNTILSQTPAPCNSDCDSN